MLQVAHAMHACDECFDFIGETLPYTRVLYCAAMHNMVYNVVNIASSKASAHSEAKRKMSPASFPLFCLGMITMACIVSESNQATHPIATISHCGQYDSPLDEELMETLRQVQQQLGPPGCNPPQNRSCQEILYCFPSALSGYYQISALNRSQVIQVYCDMGGIKCGGEGGWTRVAYVNMSQPDATCPQGLTERDSSGLALCGRNYNIYSAKGGCQSAFFSSHGLKYTRVCGQLLGYQHGTPDAFGTTISEQYVDGATITYGSNPRKHIWTYANGASYFSFVSTTYICPCTMNSTAQVPAFVGSDYYCETGNNANGVLFQFFPNDRLWDGQQCVGAEASCCTPHPNMPWFTRTLNEATMEDIEVRVCGDQGIDDEDTMLQVIELFVYTD